MTESKLVCTLAGGPLDYETLVFSFLNLLVNPTLLRLLSKYVFVLYFFNSSICEHLNEIKNSDIIIWIFNYIVVDKQQNFVYQSLPYLTCK